MNRTTKTKLISGISIVVICSSLLLSYELLIPTSSVNKISSTDAKDILLKSDRLSISDNVFNYTDRNLLSVQKSNSSSKYSDKYVYDVSGYGIDKGIEYEGIDRTSELYMVGISDRILHNPSNSDNLWEVNQEIYNIYSHMLEKCNNIPITGKDPLLWSVKTFNETSYGQGLIASCISTKNVKNLTAKTLYDYSIADAYRDGWLEFMNNPQQGPYQMDANYGTRVGYLYPEKAGLDEYEILKSENITNVNWSRVSKTYGNSKYGDRWNPYDMIHKQMSEINQMYKDYYSNNNYYNLNDLGVYALMCIGYNCGSVFISNPHANISQRWFYPFKYNSENIYKFCKYISTGNIAEYIENKALQSLLDGKTYVHKPASDEVVLDWVQEWIDNGWLPEDILNPISSIKLQGTWRARPTYPIKSIYMYFQAVHLYY